MGGFIAIESVVCSRDVVDGDWKDVMGFFTNGSSNVRNSNPRGFLNPDVFPKNGFF